MFFHPNKKRFERLIVKGDEGIEVDALFIDGFIGQDKQGDGQRANHETPQSEDAR